MDREGFISVTSLFLSTPLWVRRDAVTAFGGAREGIGFVCVDGATFETKETAEELYALFFGTANDTP